ncbi:MAG: ABC transporter permease [Phycisphaerales bacterium]|nr:ABC transporter permease [Phycisphaerales bacterium]
MAFLLEIIGVGLGNLSLHKLRTFLTSLGIILGVSAVIVVVSMGEGNKRSALRDIEALGATNVILRSSRPTTNKSGSQANSWIFNYGLSRLDQRRIEAAFEGEALVVPLKATGGEVRRGGERLVSQAFGTMPGFQDVANLRLTPRSRYLTQEDILNNSPVAVVGHEVARKFFPLEDPIGSQILIDEVVFTVVGILEPIGFAGGSGAAQLDRDLNKDIHVPITTAYERFGDLLVRRDSGTFSGEEIEVSELYINTRSTQEVLAASQRARRIVELTHPGLKDIDLIVPWELLENAKRSMLVWNIMLVAIAAISLLVGGIGIMNIMLASITERTREIGIRRAMGATRNHIVLQFLVETGSLSAVGGLIGILLGISVSLGLKTLVPWILSLAFFKGTFEGNLSVEPVVTLWSIVVSFLVAAGVGLIFGIYPAIVASRKDPIVALRHD